MINKYHINGRLLKTGDVTKNGTNSIYSLGAKVLGSLVPGNVDHTIICTWVLAVYALNQAYME